MTAPVGPAPLDRERLAERIERLGADIARRAMTIMYAHPFWDDRFGARGRRFAEDDGLHHVNYLCEALRLDQPQVLVRYARWLQTVLTTRGMCTAHLDENLERIGGVILSEALPDGQLADAFLQHGRRALLYEPGPARDVQDASDAIGIAARALLDAADPRWRDRWGRDGGTRLTARVEWPVSYLADALALGRDEQLAGYLAWLADFTERHGVARADLAALLDALGSALGRLPPATVSPARAAFARARALAATIESPAAR